MFEEAGLAVVGVSADSFESHRDFAAKYSLPFTLLTDQGGALRRRFGDPQGWEAPAVRMTYVVGADGVILGCCGGEGIGVDEHLRFAAEWAGRLRAAPRPR